MSSKNNFHWIRIDTLRDLYLYDCKLNNTIPTLTGLIKAIRKYIKFIIKDLKQVCGIVVKTGVYTFTNDELRIKLTEQFNNLPVNTEIMEGFKKISEGAYEIEGQTGIFVTGIGGAIDTWISLDKELKRISNGINKRDSNA